MVMLNNALTGSILEDDLYKLTLNKSRQNNKWPMNSLLNNLLTDRHKKAALRLLKHWLKEDHILITNSALSKVVI
jgi:hypothetical protein